MGIDDIIERVCALVAEITSRREDTIVGSESFANYGIDSLLLIELVDRVETQEGVSIPDDDLTSENLRSAESLARLIERLKGVCKR